MAGEVTIARESGVNPINSISSRTRNYASDEYTVANITAINRREANLLLSYGAFDETPQGNRNYERIKRAANSLRRRV